MDHETLTVATANTHEGRMLKTAGGLQPFVEAEVDVLLMQEVLGFNQDELTETLYQHDYALAAYAGSLGLATAVHVERIFDIEQQSVHLHKLHEPSWRERGLQRVQPNSHRLRERGALSVGIQLEGATVNVANTHPIVFVRPWSRQQQVRALGRAFYSFPYDRRPLIVAGDMNHYPYARKVDVEMQNDLSLRRVQPDRPTWVAKGSRHEWLAHLNDRRTGRQNSLDAELDAVLYRGLHLVASQVVDIASDHRAIVATFTR